MDKSPNEGIPMRWPCRRVVAWHFQKADVEFDVSEPIVVSMPIASVEMQEFLFAETLARVASVCEEKKHNVVDWSQLKKQTRQSFRLQRFAVMNWLIMNGVSIPSALLSNEAHPAVGSQMPDKKSF